MADLKAAAGIFVQVGTEPEPRAGICKHNTW
jgi:hypothetical protein